MNENNFKFKKILIIFLFILTLGLIIFSLLSDYNKNQQEETKTDNPIVTSKDITESCYYRKTLTKNGLSDIAWLKIIGNDIAVSGELRNLPAETDSKIGLFEGQIIETNSLENLKKANVIWDTFAEGMRNKEELIFDYGEQYAIVYFGEAFDRGDGVYMFKNKNNLFPQSKMNKIDCLELEEKIAVEEYIRENIKTLSVAKEVLGGSWYVTKITIDSQNKNGEVEYEDGHILEKATFDYAYDPDTKAISIFEFQ
jgi:hypothetical protein